MNKAWLRCEVSRGMFSNERAIWITTAEGNVISFFLDDYLVKNDEIEVGVVDRDEEFGVVMLPQGTFGGSSVAQVPMTNLRFA